MSTEALSAPVAMQIPELRRVVHAAAHQEVSTVVEGHIPNTRRVVLESGHARRRLEAPNLDRVLGLFHEDAFARACAAEVRRDNVSGISIVGGLARLNRGSEHPRRRCQSQGEFRWD